MKRNGMQTALEATFKTTEELTYVNDKRNYEHNLTTELHNILDM
jgi:hypothetical protein